MESKFNSLTYNNSVTLNWHILLSYLEIKLFPSALAETQGLPGNEIIFEAQVFMKQMPFWKKVGNLHQNFYYAYAVSRTHQVFDKVLYLSGLVACRITDQMDSVWLLLLFGIPFLQFDTVLVLRGFIVFFLSITHLWVECAVHPPHKPLLH